MQLTHLLLLTMAAIALSPAEQSAIRHPASDSSATPFQLKLRTGDQPNEYSAELTWEAPPDFQGLYRVERTMLVPGKPQETTPDIVSGEATSYSEANLPAGAHVSYKVTAIGKDSTEHAIGTGEMDVPTDALIDRPTEARSLQFEPETGGIRIAKYNRIFFAPGGVISGGMETVRIETGEIHVAPGTVGIIQNLAAGTKAPLIATRCYFWHCDYSGFGHPGGEIFVYARTGTGKLKVISRGQDGADGLPGANGYSGAPGAAGAGGSATHCHGGGMGESECAAGCDAQPQNGAPGGNGGNGGDGGDGWRGGNSAPIHIKIDNPGLLQIDWESLPGVGGKGGSAGNGGAPGPGGAAGPRNDNYCNEAHPGPAGQPGSPGRPGHDGQKGDASQVCAELGNVRIGC